MEQKWKEGRVPMCIFSMIAKSSITDGGNPQGQPPLVCETRLWFGKVAEVSEPEPDVF